MILMFLFWLWFFNRLWLPPTPEHVILGCAVAATFITVDLWHFSQWLYRR